MDDDGNLLLIAYQSGYYDGKKAAQPAQEPAFWLNEQGQLSATRGFAERHSIGQKIIPLYTTPPAAQRKPVDLTNDEINNIANGCHLGKSVQGAIREALDKYKEKNT
jgi:hypothetical protein